jgi:hypothetical protein
MEDLVSGAGVPTRAEILLSRLEKGGDIDDDYVIGLLNSSLKRLLTLAEARYLEKCIFDMKGSDVQMPDEGK